MKRALQILLAAAVTAGALAYALWGVDFGRLGSALAGARLWVLLPFEVLVVAFYAATGWRWNLILRPLGRYSLRESGPAMMIGFAGNNVLPAHLGELVRAVVFGRRAGVPASGVFVTLVVERLLDVWAILMCYFAAVLLVAPFPGALHLGAEVVGAVVAAGSLAIVAFLAAPQAFLRAWERATAWLPARLRERGTGLLRNAATALAALKSPWLLAGMLAWSLAKWSACGGMVWLSLYAFGAPITFGVSLVVVAVSALAVTVPAAPGFFGTIQAAFVFALTPFGISQEVALAASVLYLLAQWAPTVAFGAVCFFATGLKAGDVRAEAGRLEAQAGP